MTAPLSESPRADRPQAHQLVIMDELWRPMRAAPRMVQRIDSLTRLNRTKGAGTMKCTHTMSDFLALGSETRQPPPPGGGARQCQHP